VIEMREKQLFAVCPVCEGHKGVAGRSDGLYKGPATLPCDRCDALGEVPLDSLTDAEKNPKPKKFFERDDNP
jgi:hypothetical protein